MLNWYAFLPWRDSGAEPPSRPLASPPGTVAAALSYRETGDPFPESHEARRSLRIGLCSSLSWGFLRELIGRVRALPSPPDLSFVEGSPRELAADVRRGRLDVAFVFGPCEVGQLKSEPLWAEPVLLLAPERDPLARSNAVQPAALRQERFLACGGPEDFANQLGLIEQTIGGTPAGLDCLRLSREALMNMVGLGFGVALSPSSSMGAFYPGVAYRPIAGPAPAVSFQAVWQEHNRNPDLGPFLATARAFSARWAHDPAHVPMREAS